MDPVAIVNAVAAWLNGDLEHASREGLFVDRAVVDDATLVVILQPLDDGKLPFRASFELRAVESQTFAHARQQTPD
jgi:hypothetical protein